MSAWILGFFKLPLATHPVEVDWLVSGNWVPWARCNGVVLAARVAEHLTNYRIRNRSRVLIEVCDGIVKETVT